MSWLWWKQGGEIAALRTDLTAAYAELETLRARPEVVSAPPLVPEPAAVDPASVLPAADAADAADAVPAATGVVELVPASEVIAPPAASASQPQTTQAR
jgi:hypothetical protein